MKLAQNEQVIGDWEYAKKKTRKGLFKRDRISSNLLLTNRRLIHDTTAKRYRERIELNLNQVDSITYYHSRLPNFWAILQLILGIILCVVLIGIPIVRSALSKINRGDFTLAIYTKGIMTKSFSLKNGKHGFDESAPIAAGIGTIFGFILRVILSIVLSPFLLIGAIFKLFGASPKKAVVKMTVNHDVIDEIIDSLGAAVINCQS